MTLPQFNAEQSLGPSAGRYQVGPGTTSYRMGSSVGIQPQVDSLQCLAGCAICSTRPQIQRAACYHNVEHLYGPCQCVVGHLAPMPFAPHEEL